MVQKGIFYIISLMLLALTASSSKLLANNPEQATKYYNKMLKTVSSLEKGKWKYLTAIAKDEHYTILNRKRNSLLRDYDSVLRSLHKQKAYLGDNDLRSSYMYYIKLKRESLNNNFVQLTNFKNIQEQSYDVFEAVSIAREEIDQKVNTAWSKVDASKEKFITTYKVTDIKDESEKAKKIKIAEKSMAYVNDLDDRLEDLEVMMFYATNALFSRDVAGLHQNINNIESYLDESIKVLDTIAGYRGNDYLINSAKEVFKIYAKEVPPSNERLLELYDYLEEAIKIQEKKSGDGFKDLKSAQRNKIIFQQLEKDKTFEDLLSAQVEQQKKMDRCHNKWRLAKIEFNKRYILNL